MLEHEPMPKVREEFVRRDQAEQKIREHIERYEMPSARFQAFCDFVDLQQVESEKDETQAKLILETIRQRKNGIPGYKREYREISELTDDLMSSLHENDSFTGRKVYDQRRVFQNLVLPRQKNGAIERFDQKSRSGTSSRK